MAQLSTISYRPEVDGLRTIAIIPVLLFHLGLSWVPAGYLGVDVFFVISGYLISLILLRDLQAGTFCFRDFWARRVRRIMPALLVVVAVTVLLYWAFGYRPEVRSAAWDGLAASLSWANFRVFSEYGDYWGASAESSPFLHAWSLSLEEQFYLFYPLALWFLAKIGAPLGKTLLVGLVVSLVLFGRLSSVDSAFTFYMLPTRAWELLAGGLVAIYGVRIKEAVGPTWAQVGVLAGLVMITASYLFVQETSTSLFAVLPVLGASAVITFGGGNDRGSRLLASKPLTFIGKISYSLYLWHWPLILVAGVLASQQGWEIATWSIVALSFVLATLSFYFIEQPLRRSPKGVIASLGLLVITLMTIAVVLAQSRQPYDISAYDTVVFYGVRYNATPSAYKQISKSEEDSERVKEAETVPRPVGFAKRDGIIVPGVLAFNRDAFRSGGIPGGARGSEQGTVIVIGDSHGAMWAKTLDEVAESLKLSARFFTTVGNDPFFSLPFEDSPSRGRGFTADEFRDFRQSVVDTLTAPGPKVMVFASKWSSKNSKDMQKITQLAIYAAEQGAKVLFIGQPPIAGIGDTNSAQFLAYRGVLPREGRDFTLNTVETIRVVDANRRIEEIAHSIDGAIFVSAYEVFSRSDEAWVLRGREILYYDDDHLSYQGTSLMKERLTMEIAGLLPYGDEK